MKSVFLFLRFPGFVSVKKHPPRKLGICLLPVPFFQTRLAHLINENLSRLNYYYKIRGCSFNPCGEQKRFKFNHNKTDAAVNKLVRFSGPAAFTVWRLRLT